MPTVIQIWDNFKLRNGFSLHHSMTSALEQARFNMIEQQIRTWEVLDQRVLDVLFRVRREDYTPEIYRALAFMDMEIPLGHGEKMLQPKQGAHMLQALELAPSDWVLEIGTGSGYMTALLASMSAHVYSVDIHEDFTHSAGAKLRQHDVTNVTLETGDAARGWDRHGPYDAIVLTGSVPILSENFKRSLKPGARLVVVLGEPPVMQAQLITCLGAAAYNTIALFETCIAPLKNAPQPERFVF
jgi:protein-L-isoaspartate(D-aspartate) O-methyltransferase